MPSFERLIGKGVSVEDEQIYLFKYERLNYKDELNFLFVNDKHELVIYFFIFLRFTRIKLTTFKVKSLCCLT